MSDNDLITGGCYCKAVRYECRRPLRFQGLCFCRTCQMISGGAGNLFAAVDADTFRFTSGSPRSFTNEEHAWRPTRHFCDICGSGRRRPPASVDPLGLPCFSPRNPSNSATGMEACTNSAQSSL